MTATIIDLDYFDAVDTVAGDSDRLICHRMPCTIHHNGQAQVEEFFLPAIKQDRDGIMTSSFRGRPLAGHKMNLPKNYTGLNIVCDDGSQSTTEKCTTTTWKVKQKFDTFTYWNWDKIPSANDKIQQVFTWLDIANAINRDTSFVQKENGDTPKI